MPELTLNSPIFVEPNPFNPPGTCASAADGCPDYSFDLTKEAGFKKNPDGTVSVRAYTDLKRHNLCDDPGPGAIRWFCNEQLAQGRPDDAFEGKPGTEYFLTRKLWDVGNTDRNAIAGLLQPGHHCRPFRLKINHGPDCLPC